MTTFNGVLDAATHNANSSNELAIAAGEVIARRVALGVAAAFDPMQADYAEFGRMLPEKMQAFSAAGTIMLEQSSQAGWEITRLASDEVMTTARAARELTDCWGPAAFAEAQNRLAREWLNRATSNFFTMGMLALTAQAAAMAPIHQTVVGNAERLAE